MKDYHEKLKREKDWYKQTDHSSNFVRKILKSKILYNAYRNDFNYIFPKTQAANKVRLHLNSKKVKNLLIAPCGRGDDYKYYRTFADSLYGLDLSSIALNSAPTEMITKQGDILESGYPSSMFEIIICSLFFHHMVHVGFDSFLNEFYRILQPGGGLAILEPSLYYPLNIITRPIKHIFNNPFNEVEDEGPFQPQLLVNSLKRSGFINIEMKPATFSHCSFYIPLAKFINRITSPLLKISFMANFSWMVVYWAEKPLG